MEHSKEVLDWARQKWAEADALEKKNWEAAFPELKESEGEEIREAIEGVIRVYGKTQGGWIGGYDMDTLVVHLREAFGALEKQKEQRPADIAPNQFDGITYGMSGASTEHSAEWSEEDKTIIDCAVEVVEKAGLPSLAASIKSLRPYPHWKPSEEQMEWLESAVRLSTDKPRIHGIIISLYEQLKRL